jgi:hypothetical protein
MNKFKCVFLGILLLGFQFKGISQSGFLKKMQSLKSAITKAALPQKSVKDSAAPKTAEVTKKTETPKKEVSPKKAAPQKEMVKKGFFKKEKPKADTVIKLTQQQSDSAFLKHPLKDAIIKLKQNFKKTWNNVFIDFTDNEIYLLGGMNLSKQNVNVGDYNSNFNYDLTDYNKNAYKPGYFIGYRVDGKFKEKHNYSFAMSLNKIASGANYQSTTTLSPFLGTFSKFKADDQFFTLSMAAHYRKLLVIGDTVKRKFYVVAGPSMDARLSEQSADNIVNGNYHRFIFRADIGFEFDNQSFYTFFVHYKQALNSFTKAPIKTNMNSVEIGMMFKAKDLF